jgi:hypothetical protein
MDTLIFSADRQVSATSIGLGTRCLSAPPSRRPDDEIYCAIHKVTDWNPLIKDQQFRARESGEVLVEHFPDEGLCWIEPLPSRQSLDMPS